MKLRTHLLTLALLLAGIGAYAQCGPLTTIYAGNNAQDGIMFDIVAVNSVVITGFDIDAYGNTHDYEIYYHPGTHVGTETNAAAWTLAGQAFGVPGNPRNSPTNIPITLAIPMCAGDRYAFYLTSTSTSGSVSYTNGTAVGALEASDANIQIFEGTGKDYPFNFSYTPRVPNITCYYNCATSCCLPPTMTSTAESCAGACDGTATGTVGAGGVPPYTYQWDAAAGNQTTQTATGLCAGTYTLTVTDGSGCAAPNTVTVAAGPPGADATITPVGPFCPGDPAINCTGADPGGTWSGTGITDPVNGTFDPMTAGPGTHTITYTIAGPCGDTQTYNIVVNNNANATITPAGPFCESDASVNLVGADPGGTWSGNGITDPVNGTFDPMTATPGTHTITYSIPGTCGDTQTTNITVNPDVDATIAPAGPYCVGDPVATMVGADPGGTWSGTGITDPVNGTFDPMTAGTGTHTITYSIGGACPDVQTYNVVVNTSFDATITPAGPFCESDAAVNLTAVDPGGTWSGTGITDPVNGTFDPLSATPGTWTITYTIPGGCGDTQTTNITVNPDMDATITPAGPFCLGDLPVNMVGADPGGNWSGTGITDPVNGTFDPATAGVGTHTITYDITGACGDLQTYNVVVNTSWDATITPAGPFCESNIPATLTAASPGGTWSGQGITDPVNGTFDPMTATPGTWTITYTIPGACGATDTEDILVIADEDATITPAGPFCTSDAPSNMMAVGTGGTWTGTGITDPANGTFDPAIAGPGSHVITYQIPGACGDTDTETIVVNNQMDATITPVGPFCEDDPSITMTAVDVGGTWSGTGITDPVNGTFDPMTATSGTWTITYTISGNCGDVQTTQITITPRADASITQVGPFCVGEVATNLVGADPGGTWSGAGITDPANGTFDPATAGVGTHTVTYTVGGPCPDTQTSDIVIVPNDDPTITSPGSFCESDASINLVAATGGGTWSGNGITDPVAGTFDPSTAGAGTHTVTYTIAGNCGGTDTEDILVSPLAVIDFISDVNTGCIPLAVNFTDNSLPAGVTALWDFGDGNTSTTLGTATHTYNAEGCYDVTLTLTTANGCVSTMTVPNMVCASDYPVPYFVFGPQPTTIVNTNIQFMNGTTGADSYTWDFAGLGTSTDDSPSFTFPVDSAGAYDVCLTASNNAGCTDSICYTVVIGEEFLIYVPNAFTPDGDGVNDFFVPTISGITDTDYEFFIFNRWGEMIFYSQNPGIAWDGTYKGLKSKQDVYVWKVKARSSGTSERKEYVGHVTLIR